MVMLVMVAAMDLLTARVMAFKNPIIILRKLIIRRVVVFTISSTMEALVTQIARRYLEDMITTGIGGLPTPIAINITEAGIVTILDAGKIILPGMLDNRKTMQGNKNGERKQEAVKILLHRSVPGSRRLLRTEREVLNTALATEIGTITASAR